MKKHHLLLCIFSALGLLLLAVVYSALQEEITTIDKYTSAPRLPRIDPDYTGIVIPPNIAPLNFSLNEPGIEYQVEIYSTRGDSIKVSSTTPQIQIPPGLWKKVLAENRGRDIYFEIYVREMSGQWIRFNRITNTIAPDEIDGYLVYRLLKPLYNKYVDIGIYQRNLQNYDESAVLHNRNADHACLNCHTFLNNRPDPFILHTRSRHGLTMLLARNDTVTTVRTRTEFNSSPAAYSSWHPSGKLVGFSVNKVSLFFHTVGETRDVFDAASDLALYLIDSNTLTTTADISKPDYLETWPTWSPDGRFLYFSSAPQLPIERFEEVRYHLMRIGYDVDSGTWGDLETVLSADDTGLSITQPRLSPDGRFLLFCMADYGSFPIYLSSSDLYLMDLKSGQYRRLAINSERADTWHSWSSNSRWIVFSSKRRDGLLAKPYLSYVDEDGNAHKPILLPQEDPEFYGSFIKTYNLPELVKAPVQAELRDLGRAVLAPHFPLTAELDPRVQVQ